MDVQQAIQARRAYRALEPVEITDELVTDLAQSLQLAPSCFNKQPWRFVFVYDPEALEAMHAALSPGNKWAKEASMIIAVCSNRDLDCVTGGREYYLFDTGMGTAFLLLRATELGLVAHPIAGYDQEKAKEVIGIPPEMTVITLVIVGKHSETLTPVLSDFQRQMEKSRPERLPLKAFAHLNRYPAA